ncbi:MAG: nucleoside 2-deoxyribosyltransferase [Clostridiales Family XIII bacterium]|jgi:hypothetical protein|nr:nucleoside 2-deoxyribosyltransferase [Clostridiales Family XIII bacterium]
MNKKCFVIQPFDGETFDRRYNDIIEPVIRETGLDPYRVDKDPSVAIPIKSIEEEITNSRLCVADITTDNPNVWYEVGYAFASHKDVILLCSDERTGGYPFDVSYRNILVYKTKSPSDFACFTKTLIERIKAILFAGSDDDGFYYARIAETRNVPDKNGKSFNCYRPDRLIDTDAAPVQNESHWLLYEKGKFISLFDGDKIKFKFSQITNISNYPEIENARNIYPVVLAKQPE